MKNPYNIIESAPLIDIIPIPICYVDKEGVFTFRNKRFIDVFGYDEKDVPTLKEWWLKAYPDEDYRKWVTINWELAVNNAAKTGSDIQSEVYNVTCKNGIVRNIIISGSTINDEILATFFDITELKQAEKNLLANEERFILANKASDNGIWDWLTLENKVYYSDQWKAQLGYKPNEIANEFKSWEDLLHPDCKEDMSQKLREFLSNPTDFFIAEFRMKHKDGSYRWIGNKAASVRDENGKVIRMYGAHTDITKRKEAEIELLEKNNFIDKIIEGSAISIWISDDKGTLIRANPACLKFFGATEEEVVGKYNLFGDKVIEEKGFIPEIKKVFEKGEVADILVDYDLSAVEVVNVKNATHKIVNSIFTPIFDRNEKVSNVIVQSIDLTNIKKAEEELKNHRDSLEELIKARTKELEDKNKELDNALLVFVGREQTIKKLEERIKAFEGR
ncbi:MAG: PAS domain S-box protein [Bacteroidales bacterium]|nr:PAS domain S-box protein [Bacteroidales bacterium]MCF8390760.1 PAS domain S-box protein [Bacteroidales bacterium]